MRKAEQLEMFGGSESFPQGSDPSDDFAVWLQSMGIRLQVIQSHSRIKGDGQQESGSFPSTPSIR